MKKILGIDIGGSNIKIILMGDRPERSTIIKTPKNKVAFFKALEKVMHEFPLPQISGIGIGVPGLIDRKSGKVLMTPNLPFLKGADFKKFFGRYHKRLAFDNDVKCVLRAEAKFGAARGLNNAVLMALGTGIGGGLLLNGEIYLGQGSAGEVGHVVVDGSKTFEQLAGGKSFKNRSDQEFRRVGKYVGIMCANFINLLDPQAIILAGGVGANESKKYFKYVKPEIKKYALAAKARKTKIVIGELGELAGAVGACLLLSK